jgi:hypothetical protein
VTGGYHVLKVDGGKGSYNKLFKGEPAKGLKELWFQYSLGVDENGDPKCSQVHLHEDAPIVICEGIAGSGAEAMGALSIKLEVAPETPLVLRLDSSALQALIELGDALTDPCAEDAEFDELPSFYNDMADALWSVGESVGVTIFIPKLEVLLSPPNISLQGASGSAFYPNGELLKLEVNHVQLNIHHHGSEHAIVENAGAIGQEMVLALGSLELMDKLPGLTAPLILGTPRAYTGVENWIDILHWPIVAADGQAPEGLPPLPPPSLLPHPPAPLLSPEGFLPDIKLYFKRVPNYSIQSHFANVAFRLNYPIQLHAGIELLGRLSHYGSELGDKLELQGQALELRNQKRIKMITEWHEEHPEAVGQKSESVADRLRKARNSAAAAAGALMSIDQLDIEPIELRVWWAQSNGKDFKIHKAHTMDLADIDNPLIAVSGVRDWSS